MRYPKAKAIEHLRKSLDRNQELKRLRYDDHAFDKWLRDTKVVLINVFGEGSRPTKEFKKISFTPWMWTLGESDGTFQRAYQSGLGRAEAILLSMIEEIEEFWDEDPISTTSDHKHLIANPSTKKVFVVHGRDIGAKDTVTRFLEALDLEPIVLQEQPDRGRTVIEKFEEYADQCGFAVVLCTPDDFGGLASDNGETEQRARQNVIFELGFFVGKLGRGFVSLVVKGDVKIPTDYVGVLHTKLDESDGWKNKLVGELKSAGFEVDANRLYEPAN